MDTATTAVIGILTAVVTSLVTAWITSRVYVHQATTDLRAEYQRRFNEKKWITYTGFSSTVREVLTQVVKRDDVDVDALAPQLLGFISEIWLIGSDDVLRAVLKWRRYSPGPTQDPHAPLKDPQTPLKLVAQILIEMRKDLGDTSTKIEAKDILGTFVSDS